MPYPLTMCTVLSTVRYTSYVCHLHYTPSHMSTMSGMYHILATHNLTHYTHHASQVFPSSHASTHTQCIAHTPTPTLHAADSHNLLLTSYIPIHRPAHHTQQCAHTAHPSESLLPHPKALRPEVLSRVLARRLCCLVREEHPFSNEDIAGVKGSRAVGRHSVLFMRGRSCVSVCPLGNLVPSHASLDYDQGRVSLSCSSPVLCNVSIPRSPRRHNQCPMTWSLPLTL